jgi:toxin YoeB
MRRVAFDEQAWDDYTEWGRLDRKMQAKIIELIDASRRDPFHGIGKPELLKHQYRGCWARRINQEDRLVYRVFDEEIRIVSCKDHY